MTRIAVAWFRRDLRIHDHPALTAAAAADAVVPLYIVDPRLITGPSRSPNRAWFLRESLVELAGTLDALGAPMRIEMGDPVEVVPRVVDEVGAADVYVTRDATPYGRRRDRLVAEACALRGVAVHPRRGLYVHEPDEIATGDGRSYSVFSPFHRAWLARAVRAVLPAPDRLLGLPGVEGDPVPGLSAFGIAGGPDAEPGALPVPGEAAARRRLEVWLAATDGGRSPVDEYAAARDRLDRAATSRLSQDLRFGLLSPVEVRARAAGAGDGRRVFGTELAWRDFYAHVLWHHPRVRREPFLRAFAALPWRTGPDADADFAAWSEGRTGFPVVDAAMRQLRRTGFMHNRARMISASFLAKDLLLDWHLGEAHFLRHLVDGDVASNSGGWQWAASVGTDPQPYFRIFNPVLQGRRFDPDGTFVRSWIPELTRVPTARIHDPWSMLAAEMSASGCRIGIEYPAPIVDHAAARERALAVYGAARAGFPG